MSTPDNHVPEFTKDIQRLAGLAEAPTGLTPAELEQYDPFGLLNVVRAETLEVSAAQKIFQDCEEITFAQASHDPTILESWKAGKDLTFPEVQISPDHRYQLSRQAQESGTHYLFKRLGEDYEKSGFQVVHEVTGNFKLLPLRLPRNSLKKIEDYDALTATAQRYITAYAEKLASTPTGLSAEATSPSPKANVAKKAAKFVGRALISPFTAPYYANDKGSELYRLPFDEMTGRRTPTDHRHVSFARIALIAALVPVPGFSDNVYTPASVELGDTIFNHSEHVREAFDRQGWHLPEGSPTYAVGESGILGMTSPLAPDLARALIEAPEIDADSGVDVQDTHGGPRVITNLSHDNSALRTVVGLDKNTCDDVTVNLAASDKVRVANILPIIADQLQIKVDNGSITICNVTERAIAADLLDQIYIEVVK